MTVPVQIIYDDWSENVQAQLIRDLLVLSSEWDVSVLDPVGKIPVSFLDQLQIPLTQDPPKIELIYKTQKDWPEATPGIETVKRDLYPGDFKNTLDPNPKVGFYLRDQGRPGANLTERYLSRSYPKGRGCPDPIVVMMWG